jgi:hypothetical protein
MLILSFSLGMSMEVRRRQAGQVREGTLRYSLNRLFQVGRQGILRGYWGRTPGFAGDTRHAEDRNQGVSPVFLK